MSSETTAPVDLDDLLDQVMRDLDAASDELPEAALRLAQQHRQQIIPRLTQAIERAAAGAASGSKVEGNAHYFALVLLTEFRAKEALPAILAAMSLPGELPFDLYGDLLTERLGSYLGALCDDRTEIVDTLICNRALNEYVRWEAAQANVFFVRDGRLSRAEAIARLREHLRRAIDERDSDITTGLLCDLLNLGASEATDEIRETFRAELVDLSFMKLHHAEADLANADAEFERTMAHLLPTGVEDAVEELRPWFRQTEVASVEGEWSDDNLEFETPYEGPEPIRNEMPRIGRNDPCPCGSGTKFKKCCGRR